MDSQRAWNAWTETLWLVHFAERIGGKLATFTGVNFIANISYAMMTLVLLYCPGCAAVLPWHSDTLLPF